MDERFVTRCVELHWIEPKSGTESGLDEEDLARILLIQELQSDFGVNDEAVPIILHLLDQLHFFRNQMTKRAG
ncbi:MAG: chaperone modulator CbpM, partial [Bdellovibrionota bacterium]